MNLNSIYNKLKGDKLISDSVWSILGSVLGYGLSLFSGVILARCMGDNVFGGVGMVKKMLIYMIDLISHLPLRPIKKGISRRSTYI